MLKWHAKQKLGTWKCTCIQQTNIFFACFIINSMRIFEDLKVKLIRILLFFFWKWKHSAFIVFCLIFFRQLICSYSCRCSICYICIYTFEIWSLSLLYVQKSVLGQGYKGNYGNNNYTSVDRRHRQMWLNNTRLMVFLILMKVYWYLWEVTLKTQIMSPRGFLSGHNLLNKKGVLSTLVWERILKPVAQGIVTLTM